MNNLPYSPYTPVDRDSFTSHITNLTNLTQVVCIHLQRHNSKKRQLEKEHFLWNICDSMLYLRGLDKVDGLSGRLFYKGNNFCHGLFAFLHTFGKGQL